MAYKLSEESMSEEEAHALADALTEAGIEAEAGDGDGPQGSWDTWWGVTIWDAAALRSLVLTLAHRNVT